MSAMPHADGNGQVPADPPTSTKGSQATTIIKLAIGAGAELFHTPAGDPFITIRVNDHQEHHRLNSRGSRDYLNRLFYLDADRAPSAAAMQDAIATLSGIAKFDGDEHDVHVRVAGDDRHIYLDLADGQWRAVEITSLGWRITSAPPVRFRRSRGMLALPIPVQGGSVNELRQFVNVTDEDFPLVVAFLIAALRGRGPFPVLDFIAEQGGAKSTTTRAIRRIVDPHESELRRPPRNTEDLMIAAMNSYIVTIDNVSYLPDWLSDDCAVLSTGGGLSKRELYSDAEETIVKAQRPIILNGIGHVVTRADLLDRAIVLNLPIIPDGRRRPEADFWGAFEQALPRILGAFLDAIVMALRKHSTTTLEKLPRMADFALWNVAAEAACPWAAGTFLETYLANRQGAVEVSLEGDPVADVVRALVPWEGTASDFLGELTRRTSETITKRKDWFSRPRQVSDALRRLAPALRRIGIDVIFTREPHTGRRLIRLEKVGHDASPSSPSSPSPENRAATDDEPSPTSSPKNPDKDGLGDRGDAGDATLPLLSELRNAGRF